MKTVRRWVLGLVTLAALLLSATNAFAHARLESSTPAANATVQAPTTITLHFSDPLEPRFSGFEISDAHNHAVNATSHPDPSDPAIYVATLATPLAPGLYHVTWHLVAHDGHRMRGTFDFTVVP